MAYYKVPQDVEADDKLLGPFTFKQFIFLIGFALSGFVMFSLSRVNLVLAIPLLPVVLLFGLLGFYRPKDQPIENKMLAYINFFFKPHTRVWSRDGIVEHVHIRVPKFVEKYTSDNRTQSQVQSQLQQLASIVDTRGWSTKRSEIQAPTNFSGADMSDRIISPAELVKFNQDALEIHPYDDVFEDTNPVTESFNQLSQEASGRAKQEALARMEAARAPGVSPNSAATNPQVVQPTTSGVDNDSGQAPPDESHAAATTTSPHFEPFPHMRQRVIEPSNGGDAVQAQPATDDTVADDEHEQRLRELAHSDLPISSVVERSKQNDTDGHVLNIGH